MMPILSISRSALAFSLLLIPLAACSVAAQPAATQPSRTLEVEPSTKAVEGEFVTQVYDVAEMLIEVQKFPAPTLVSGYVDAGDHLSLLFDSDESELVTHGELLEEVVDLVTETVGTPDEWIDQTSTIHEFRGSLIVGTSRTNHQQIEALLDQLPHTGDAMVEVQADVFRVSRNAFDQLIAANSGSLVLAAQHADARRDSLLRDASRRIAAVRLVGLNGQQINSVALSTREVDASDAEGEKEPSPDAVTVEKREGFVLEVLPTVIRGGAEVVVAVKGDVVVLPEMTEVGGDASNAPAGVQTPGSDTVTYRTTVRVPRGGAVLLSGASGLMSGASVDDGEIVLLLRVRVIE